MAGYCTLLVPTDRAPKIRLGGDPCRNLVPRLREQRSTGCAGCLANRQERRALLVDRVLCLRINHGSQPVRPFTAETFGLVLLYIS